MTQELQLADDVRLKLSAQYDVIRPLGHGGMATVFLAQERLLQRYVAVKVLPAETGGDPEVRARFLREARTAARLSHPNIVPLYSFIEAEHTLLYVMGYVEGESLASLLRREGRTGSDVARRILHDVAEALGYAHAQGVVHRDVKPDNILIEASSGRAYLADFGIARDVAGSDSLTRTGLRVGTPDYMSPEQAAGDAVDGRSDLYALGIIGYRMLTGRLPFEGASMQDVLMRRLAGEADAVSAVLPEVADDLELVITKALRRQPAERWRDAAALRAAIQLDGERMPVLPDGLDNLPSLGSKMLAIHIAFALGTAVLFAWDGDSAWLKTGLVPPFIAFPIVLAGVYWRGRQEGYTWRRLLKLCFWAPAKWVGWWPRALRRPGDVWDRLPRSVRVARSLVLASTGLMTTACLPPMLLFILRAVSGDDAGAQVLIESQLYWVTFALSMSPLYGSLAWTFVWKRKFGISTIESQKLLNEPLVSPFWKRPNISVLLTDTRAALSPSLQTPDELARAIANVVAQLPPLAREPAAEAALLARESADHAARIAREIAELAQELDPEERRKLEQRLEELESNEFGSGRAQLRELVHAQLRVMDELEQRRTLLADAHERIERGLRQVWLQLTALRGGGLETDLDAAELTTRLRALCNDLEFRHAAVADVSGLLKATD